MTQILTANDEKRLRELAAQLAKGIEDPTILIERLGFTPNDYEDLSQTRTFKAILNEAMSEWQGANNTHKRIKLKAAVNVEEALPHFYQAMVNDKEPLSSRVKALEVVSRIGQLGNPEIVPQGAGQYFKLEINLGVNAQGERIAPVILENGVENVTLDHESVIIEGERAEPFRYSQSKLFDALPLESMDADDISSASE